MRGRANAETSPRAALAAVLALAVIAVTGCGAGGYTAGGGGSAASAAPTAGAPSPALASGVPAAAARTLTQRALIGWRLQNTSAFGGVRAPVFGQGRFDLAAGRGTEAIDLPEAAHQEHGTEDAVFLPATVYLQPRGRTGAVLPRGKRWLSAPLAGAETVTQNFPHFIAQAEIVNPLLLLAETEWGATRAVPLGGGRQIVDHVRARRFRVTIDLTHGLAGLRGRAAPALGEAIREQLAQATRGSVFTAIVLVDRAGRVVQVSADLPGSGEGTELLAVSYFGARVHVVAPPVGQVVDIGSLTPSGERENNGGGDSDGG
jgi:hypothetical protein